MKPSKVKINIIANFVGNGWTGLMSFIFVPLYIKIMGAESYGLVGIFTMLRSIFGILDMGLSTTMNREMAKLSIDEKNAKAMRDMVRTLGTIYWMVAFIIGAIIFFGSTVIAERWLNLNQLSTNTVEFSIKTIGIIMFLQWPIGFYSGGLIGLQRQVLLNVVNVIMATLRGAGVILILWYVSPTIESYFIWQLLISGVHTAVIMFCMWESMPRSQEPIEFRLEILKGIWKFASGMAGIMILSMILTQIDKIILSKLLSLEMFGYYTFASAVALSLSRVISPIFTALYPRFTQLVALGNHERLKELYHQGCQLMAVVILPITAVIAFFSKEILLLWSGNTDLVQNSYVIVSFLIVGTALNGLMNLPFALQLAFSWTRLSFYVNVVAVIILVPLVSVLAYYFGAPGAASAWVILNFSYIVITIQIMHSKILINEKKEWYLFDMSIPFVVSFATVGISRLLFSSQSNKLMIIIYLLFTLLVSLVLTSFLLPKIRHQLFLYTQTVFRIVTKSSE